LHPAGTLEVVGLSLNKTNFCASLSNKALCKLKQKNNKLLCKLQQQSFVQIHIYIYIYIGASSDNKALCKFKQKPKKIVQAPITNCCSSLNNKSLS
jgi:hypothetical protein